MRARSRAHALSQCACCVQLPWRQTSFSKISYIVVWPGKGPELQDGQRVRMHWNIAKHYHALALMAPEGPPGSMPWKGDWRRRGGSHKWPDDEAFEYCFGRDPLMIPGLEEVLGHMRVGGRCHCLIPPPLGFRTEQGVRYEKPLPTDMAERDLLLAWLGARLMLLPCSFPPHGCSLARPPVRAHTHTHTRAHARAHTHTYRARVLGRRHVVAAA